MKNTRDNLYIINGYIEISFLYFTIIIRYLVYTIAKAIILLLHRFVHSVFSIFQIKFLSPTEESNFTTR